MTGPTTTAPSEAILLGSEPFTRARNIAVAVFLLAVVPTITVSSGEGGPTPLWAAAVALGGLVVFLGAPVGLSLLARRPAAPEIWAAWGLAAAMLVALAQNEPRTANGAYLVAAAFVAAALASIVASYDRSSLIRFVAAPLAVAAAIQGAIMVAQVVTGDPVGISWLRPDATLVPSDGILRPRGTMGHVFEPALLATVTLGCLASIASHVGRRLPWLVAAGAAAGVVSLSYSRAALIAVALVIVSLYVSHRRGTPGALRLAAAIGVGLVLAGVFVVPGWATKASQSATADLDDLTLGRITLVGHAVTVLADHPLVGVGPANYENLLESDYGVAERAYLPHVVTLAHAVEFGIPMAAAITALLVASCVAAIRAGPGSAAIALAMVPWLILDKQYYDRADGLLLFAVWLGLLASTMRADDSPAPGTL